MLIVDGVEYRSWTPSDEEELEAFIEKNSKEIFGEGSLYYPVKKKLESLGGVGSIPDGYAIALSKPYRWYVVEVELSSHPIFNHVVPQLNKFVQGLRDPNSRKKIVEVLYNRIKEDPVTEAFVRNKIGTGEIYRFLNKIVDTNPTLVVIIDEKTRELDEACNSIPIEDKRVVEFKIFKRVDAGIRNAFLFEPVTHKPRIERRVRAERGEITPRREYRRPILETLIEMGGKGKVSEVLSGVFNKMKKRLTKKDLEKTSTGAIRWKNRAQWARLHLKREGYLKEDSPYGIWEITDDGRSLCESLSE